MRIGAHPLLGRGDLHAPQRLLGPDRERALAVSVMEPERFDDLVANREDRIQGRLRILQDHRDTTPSNVAHLGLALGDEILALEEYLPLDDAAGRLRQQTNEREARHRLAAARLADEPERLALAQGEAHAVHGPYDAPAGVEVRPETPYVQYDRGGDGQAARLLRPA